MAVFARGNVFSCGKSSEMPRREERRGRKETTMGARGDREGEGGGRAVEEGCPECRSEICIYFQAMPIFFFVNTFER